MPERSGVESSAVAVGAVLLGAVFGFCAFVVGLMWVGEFAFLLVIIGPPLAIRFLYRARDGEFLLMSAIGIGVGIALLLLGVSGYRT